MKKQLTIIAIAADKNDKSTIFVWNGTKMEKK